MKKIIIGTILSILFIFSISFASNHPKMTYCDKANKVAQQTDRRTININKDGSYIKLLDKGKCNDQKNACVLCESYGPCGRVSQFIDSNNDGTCDYVLEWKSIVDPTYGVFFTLLGIKNK